MSEGQKRVHAPLRRIGLTSQGMADLINVLPELADRVSGMQAEAGRRGLVLVVTTGWRSLDEQWQLYDDMLAAKKAYGRKWQQHAALAAYPGTSDHGKNPATAVDLACASPTKATIKTHGELATKWGLERTVASEYWHLQLAPVRGPAPGAAPTKEQVMTLVIQPIGAVERPQHDGGWAFGRLGHVYAYGAAKHLGGWDDVTRNDPARWCVALVPSGSGSGCWLVSNKGEVYAYGDALQTGNYQLVWGPGQIVGAYLNNRQANGGVKLIRDDDVRLNEYALPE